MALHTLQLWEIIFDVTQICLGALIILFLILNRIRFKQLILRVPSGGQAQNVKTDFVVEAVHQQTELAFKHIVETIEKERQALDAYYHQRHSQMTPAIFTAVQPPAPKPDSSAETSEPDPASVIYGEIERLADQGLSLSEISEQLNVPQNEVDLVLKLKHMTTASMKKTNHPLV